MGPIIEEQTKPATEWILGHAVQKVSPRERHSRVQGNFALVLGLWARQTKLGRVGPEWDFRLAPPGEERRTLVPDVAFLSYARIAREDEEAAQFPTVAPDVVVEVLSPDDRREYIEEKRRVYHACGTKAVIEADPSRETIVIHDTYGSRTLRGTDVLTLEALPGLAVQVGELFEEP
ncbi:MAG: Uma2 family endonuclease [Burkholderiales bacterium]